MCRASTIERLPIMRVENGSCGGASGCKQAVRLLLAFHAATYRWVGPRVHFGTVLSSNTLVANAGFRAELQREFPEASAGEMELTGVYAAAANHGCGWIMAKGISDWVGGLTDGTRRAAASSAAAFVVHAIAQGTLPAPDREQRRKAL
jgi:nucleoside phosphorylase